ncbi:MCE family protein [Nocardia sp. NPDC058640]|uniref:MCE family protein n=1 Tax=Nocardia sp. NPDC058640 TaxID=3346571 RepID=UPI0036518CF5
MNARIRTRIARSIAAGGLVLALGSCSLPFGDVLSSKTKITADFQSAAGMYEGNDVMILGVKVGTVDKIVPKGLFAEVHMTVDAGVDVPSNVEAAIISPSVVTDRHIELTPPFTSGEKLKSGAHLPEQRTHTPIELEKMIETIDSFAKALGPEPGKEGLGPLSGRALYPILNGNGEKIRDTLSALSAALKVGTDNKDAIANIIIQLNDLTTMLAENDQSVRDFSNQVTQMSSMLTEQAPGLQATLDNLNLFLTNTSTALGAKSSDLAATLAGLTSVTQQLRDNSRGLTEIVDVLPMTMQNLSNAVDRNGRYVRLHALIGESLDSEMVITFCERIQMRGEACRTGNMQDFGPDYGLTAAMLGLTK